MRHLALLLFSALTSAADSWVAALPDPVQHLHAAGNLVVAWADDQIAMSNDGGLSFTPLHRPFRSQTDRQATVRVARALPTGGVMLVANGSLYLSDAGGGWDDLGATAGIAGVSVATTDGAGTIYAVSGAGPTVHVLAGPTYQAVPRGNGLPVMSLREGVVVRDRGAVSLITTTGRQAIAWRGDAESLIQPFALARSTSALRGVTFASDGTQWQLTRKELTNGTRTGAAPIIAVCTAGETTFILGHLNGERGIWEHHPQGWRTPRELERVGLPADTQNFTVTPRAFVVATPTGIVALARD